MHKAPQDCGFLADEQGLRGLNQKRADEKDDRVSRVAEWISQDGNITNQEIVERFAALGLQITGDTAYRYKVKARKTG